MPYITHPHSIEPMSYPHCVEFSHFVLLCLTGLGCEGEAHLNAGHHFEEALGEGQRREGQRREGQHREGQLREGQRREGQCSGGERRTVGEASNRMQSGLMQDEGGDKVNHVAAHSLVFGEENAQ